MAHVKGHAKQKKSSKDKTQKKFGLTKGQRSSVKETVDILGKSPRGKAAMGKITERVRKLGKGTTKGPATGKPPSKHKISDLQAIAKDFARIGEDVSAKEKQYRELEKQLKKYVKDYQKSVTSDVELMGEYGAKKARRARSYGVRPQLKK